MPSSAPPRALLQRNFRFLYGAQVVSLLGDAIVPVALAFAVLDLSGSVSDLGYALAARTLPLVAFTLIGGVFADRLPRRKVMIAADLARLGTQGALAALLLTGKARPWHLFTLLALHGTASAFFNPAATGLLPATVTPNALQEANALRGVAMSAGQVIGPAVSGVLIATVGAPWALALDAASFALSALLIGMVHVPPQQPLLRQSFLRDLLDGWAEFTARTWVWVVVLGATLGNALAAVFFVLGAEVSKRSLGGASAWSLIMVALGLGSLLGGLAAMRWRSRRPLLTGLVFMLPYGVLLIVLALEPPAAAVAAVALISGFGVMLFSALWETSLQQHVAPASLSRVSAYDWFGSLVGQPIAYASVGLVTGAIGVTVTLFLAGALSILSTLAMLAVPSVRRLTPPDVAPSLPPAVADIRGER